MRVRLTCTVRVKVGGTCTVNVKVEVTLKVRVKVKGDSHRQRFRRIHPTGFFKSTSCKTIVILLLANIKFNT